MLQSVVTLLLVLSPPVTVIRSLHREAGWRTGVPVKVVHRFGDLTISGSAQDKVVVDAVVRATAGEEKPANELAGRIDVTVLYSGDTVFVAASVADRGALQSDESYEIDVELSVPGNAELLVRNCYGNLAVTGTSAACRLQNRFGDVEVDRCRNCEVRNRHGNVKVCRSTGSLLVENDFGDVFLDGVQDRVMVENRYGNVSGSGMAGVVQLGNRLGSVVVRRSAGSVTVVNHYGDVSAWVDDSALTDLDVVSEMGQVCLKLNRLFPFRLDGSTVQGSIQSSLPVEIAESGQRRVVCGSLGRGGAAIRLTGAWADFLIQSESDEDEGR